jgi:hypothetical protein
VYGLGNSVKQAKASILESASLYIEECRASQHPRPRARKDPADGPPTASSEGR